MATNFFLVGFDAAREDLTASVGFDGVVSQESLYGRTFEEVYELIAVGL